MKPQEYGLVRMPDNSLRYFVSYEMLPEMLKVGRGKPRVKVGEFVRVTFPDGDTHDIHDSITKDRVVHAIKFIYRFPKHLTERDNENIQSNV